MSNVRNREVRLVIPSVGKWDYLEGLNTEEIRNEILKDIKKEATKNENMIALWIAVLRN